MYASRHTPTHIPTYVGAPLIHPAQRASLSLSLTLSLGAWSGVLSRGTDSARESTSGRALGSCATAARPRSQGSRTTRVHRVLCRQSVRGSGMPRGSEYHYCSYVDPPMQHHSWIGACGALLLRLSVWLLLGSTRRRCHHVLGRDRQPAQRALGAAVQGSRHDSVLSQRRWPQGASLEHSRVPLLRGHARSRHPDHSRWHDRHV